MKIASTLLIVLGSLMIVLNFFGWLGTNGLRTDLKGVNFLAYYVGYNLFLIVGIRYSRNAVWKSYRGAKPQSFLAAESSTSAGQESTMPCRLVSTW